MSGDPDELLRVEGLCKFFPVVEGVFGRTVGQVRAVDDVSFSLGRGETLGLVGESGCGKTTTGRAVLRLIEPSAGRIWFDGTDITKLSTAEMRAYRRRMQIVFQDPFGSLNPRRRVVDIVGEAIEAHGLAEGAGVERAVREVLRKVGLPASALSRYPHEFSGGQRQRIGVARAIAVSPDLIVCDEAVSALDVSIQAQIINLLIDLRADMGLAYVFIAHDLSVVRHIAERVAVMYLGEIVEIAACAAIFARPAHPYTRALLSAIPVPDPRQRRGRVVLQGDVPTPLAPPEGCHFHPRCPSAVARCSAAPPPVVQLEAGRRQVRCVHAAGLEDQSDWYEILERRLAEVAAAHPARPSVEPAPAVTPALMPASLSLPRGALANPAWGRVSEKTAPPRIDRLRRPAAGLAVAMGLGLIAYGSWGIGLLLLLCGAWGLTNSLSNSARVPGWVSRHVRFELCMLVVLAALSSHWVVPRRRAAVARVQLRWLHGEIEAYARNVGTLPHALTDLRWRLVELFGTSQPRDPWGHPYRYTRLEAGQGFDLASDGADGVASGDDIRP
jgi:oligopeptide/dipeptide ABC transporter ATP-binding protein